ncbi:MAG TPA: glycosyltransferase [Flavipsychrobacter sp.]|jgi:glycosyltransferase involved in cell wall biosynthesis|nr:glycosyltransferase [Flavipsychrobacter sp.]
MKNVLLIGSELGKGGAERSISLLSHYLEPYYNVTLCLLSGKDRERFYKTCSNVVFVDPPDARNTLDKIKGWQYRLRKIKEIKRKNAIDVSISFLEGPDYANVLTRGQEKVVLSVRGSKVFDKEIAGFTGLLRRRLLIPQLYKRADEIVCVTDALKEELQNHFHISIDKLRTIYNFYEAEQIRLLSEEALTEQERQIFLRPVIISSGRLHMQKEHGRLLEVFAVLKKKKDARLIILGDGALKSELLQQCASLGLQVCDWQETGAYHDADVYFMGFQQNAFKFYKHSAVFALSSSWEGFPNVLAEALICNIPVVTTDCYTGPREILDIQSLSRMPVDTPVHTDVGTLMPLLQNASNETICMWAGELIRQMEAPAPVKDAFEKLTERFTLKSMLDQWREVIESPKIR